MIKRHQLEKVKYINDPVYGGIGITELEWKIIDTPIFQRLRGGLIRGYRQFLRPLERG